MVVPLDHGGGSVDREKYRDIFERNLENRIGKEWIGGWLGRGEKSNE